VEIESEGCACVAVTFFAAEVRLPVTMFDNKLILARAKNSNGQPLLYIKKSVLAILFYNVVGAAIRRKRSVAALRQQMGLRIIWDFLIQPGPAFHKASRAYMQISISW
jgi:hypothetical protein